MEILREYSFLRKFTEFLTIYIPLYCRVSLILRTIHTYLIYYYDFTEYNTYFLLDVILFTNIPY